MSHMERWQLGGNAPEVYETQLVPSIFGPWAPGNVGLALARPQPNDPLQHVDGW